MRFTVVINLLLTLLLHLNVLTLANVMIRSFGGSRMFH